MMKRNVFLTGVICLMFFISHSVAFGLSEVVVDWDDDEKLTLENFKKIVENHNYNPNQQDDNLWGSLHFIVNKITRANDYGLSKNHVEDLFKILDYLLKIENIQVDQQDIDGVTPLMLAVGNYYELGTDPNFKIVEKLIDAGANTEIRNNQNSTALDIAKNCRELAIGLNMYMEIKDDTDEIIYLLEILEKCWCVKLGKSTGGFCVFLLN